MTDNEDNSLDWDGVHKAVRQMKKEHAEFSGDTNKGPALLPAPNETNLLEYQEPEKVLQIEHYKK